MVKHVAQFLGTKLLSKKALPTLTDVLRHIRHIRFRKFELENIRLGAEDISLESEIVI